MQDLFTFMTHHLALSYSLAIVLFLLAVVEFMRLKRNNFRINTTQAVHLINRQNAVIIDIRSNELFRKGHIIDAASVTAKEIMDGGKKIEKYKNKPVIIVCNSGMESQKIAASLLKRGYNAYSLSGGIRAWSDAEFNHGQQE